MKRIIIWLYRTYWTDTSSNALVSELIKTGTSELKMQMEDLLAGNCLEIALDEQVIFEQLKMKKGAIWSLLVASGYLKHEERTFHQKTSRYLYKIRLTNHEVALMFRDMITSWFPEDDTSYHNFQKALLLGDLDYMNQYMNNKERGQNELCSFGRYDVMMIPLHDSDDAIIMEFKVFSKQKDKTLEKAVENALQKINTMKYDSELLASGISKKRIRHYGFAFDGQKVLIGDGSQ